MVLDVSYAMRVVGRDDVDVGYFPPTSTPNRHHHSTHDPSTRQHFTSRIYLYIFEGRFARFGMQRDI